VGDVLLVLGVSLGVVVAAMAVTAYAAWRVGRVAVVDVFWGLGFVQVALVCALLAPFVGGGWVAWLVAGLVLVWGGRLARHIGRRARGHGEDPRYAELLSPLSPDVDRRAWFAAAVRRVFAVQAVVLWVISLPVQAAALGTVSAWWLVVAGCVVWLLGFVFEAVGDAQLAAYKADPDRGPVMDRGLWAWTRHPNYFGDACVWWGIWLVTASTGWLPALLTVLAPAVMTWFLAFGTGAKLLEKTMMQRPGYPEYAARTSMFVPRPPRGAAKRPSG
jgi:steroid 5-alpha reductase family enzyme